MGRDKRRLAAILAADIVGYSRLMGADESGTLAQLKTHRKELIDPMVEEYGGRVVKTSGDGILMEFPSVLDAVQLAVEMQRGIAERNARVPEDLRIEFRIGVNLGDIIVDGDDIYGDGVNIAARLEGIAEPGGICISRRVHEDVSDKLDLRFEDLGEKELKNIARPVQVFSVSLASDPRPSSPDSTPLPLPDKPSIAVLPFDNMSGDPEQEYFSDGITEDIITALSRFRGFTVIARNSTFSYKGKPVKVQRVSKDLGVRYVLEGSVRKAGKRVRITAQLVDATTGNHIWADRYDGGLANIFDLQDEITASVVGAIQPGVLKAEKERAKRKRPGHLDAYDLYMRGRWSFSQHTKEGFAEARELFLRATEVDGGFAAAYTMLAAGRYVKFTLSQAANPQETLAEAVQAAQRAISLDGGDAETHLVLSSCLTFRRQYDLAIAEADRAVELNPNLAIAYAARSYAGTYCGRASDGVADALTALRIGPQDPGRSAFLSALSVARYVSRDYEKAADAARKWTGAPAPHSLGYLNLAAACGQLGRSQEAQHALREGMQPYPDISTAFISARWPYKDVADFDHFVDGLRMAGWSPVP